MRRYSRCPLIFLVCRVGTSGMLIRGGGYVFLCTVPLFTIHGHVAQTDETPSPMLVKGLSRDETRRLPYQARNDSP